MYYKEFLRARKAVYVYSLVALSVFLATSLLTFWLQMGLDKGKIHGSGPHVQAWPDLLSVAALLAAIVATVLGSVLSQENDGHLEIALTRPRSRLAYATTSMLIDIGAILVVEAVGMALIIAHFDIFHRPGSWCCDSITLVAGPDPFFNALRFVLFPIAWYVLIAALGARLRGGGLVQGLVWPVALVLAGLRAIPSAGIWTPWHDLLVVINVVNPLIYAYQDSSSSNAGLHVLNAGVMAGAGSALALAAYVGIGWALAIVQWRRVEA